MPTDDDPLTTEREYLVVRPTTTALDPDHVGTACRALHAAGGDDTPTVEILLTTTGSADGVTYCFGATGLQTQELKRHLQRAFPREYELSATTTTLTDLVTARPPSSSKSRTETGESDDPTDSTARSLADRPVAGLELLASEAWSSDWQTRLRPFESFATDKRTNWPLSTVLSTLASTETPVVFQVLLEPRPDWTMDATATIDRYHSPQFSWADRLVAELSPDSAEWERKSKRDLPPDRRERIESIESVDASKSFHVNARALAFEPPTSETATDGGASPSRQTDTGPRSDALGQSTSGVDHSPPPTEDANEGRPAETLAPEDTLKELESAFADVSTEFYRLTPVRYELDSDDATALLDSVVSRTLRGFRLSRRLEAGLGLSIPFSTNTHPRIVADPTTVGSFCVFGGADLPESATRALETRPGERTGLDLPPERVLDTYRTDGFEIGLPLTGDRTRLAEPLAVPPALQRLHMLIGGGTGSGKSVFGVTGLLPNHAATEGATVVFDPKDGQMADEYERAHYATYGTLENVYRFDAAEMVPAEPFFDVTRQQESGVARSQAVEDVADHTEELLEALMGEEQFNRAVASPLVIEAIVKAMFDPVHGSDQFTLEALQRRIGRFAETGHTPPVIDAGLRRELQRIAETNDDTLANIIDGAARRVAKAAMDSRIAPLFSYAPQSEDGPTVESFDWRAKLDEDCVVIIETSKLRAEPQRALTLVVLSQIWTALKRRERERRQQFGTSADPPLVNIHLEESATVAASGIVADLLREGRSFGVGVTLSLQYPKQLQRIDEAAYDEAVNNIGTIVSGNVTDDAALAKLFTTDDEAPADAANRLRGLAPGEWLASLPTPFGAEPSRPILLDSLPLPPGHPEGDHSLSATRRATFEAARTQRAERSRRQAISLTQTASVTAFSPTDGRESHAESDPEKPLATEHTTLDTTLPFTRRLPGAVEFHPPSQSIACAACGTRYGRRLASLIDAIECHGDLAAVDRADVPTVDAGVTRSPAERSTYEYSDAQFLCLQLVYNAHQREYDTRWEYDIVHDGMERLRAYAGLSEEAFDELIVDGLVSIDGRHPHTLYTVTPKGRELIGAAHREGHAHGDGVGDLSESSLHVMMVETMRRGFESQFVDDPDHPAASVETYYPVEDGRLDVAVLDGDGDVVITGEAERSNHDTLRAVPADYDKMAACDPDRAYWVVEGRSEGHEVIRALHNPGGGNPRIERTYSESYALTRVAFDEPGFSNILTIGSFRNRFLDTPGW
ncbi:ATP-binding protein [Halosimplex salinum]|uniref:ATP-binding protein n=1 Tax=Halosimplex salinum TaxID=1710538 RepID=UPI000F47B1AB|nr:ATP-binding protein [Halosimplex salinum]